ncbi:MAG: ral secretion pathway protein GspJ [Bacteriovoracaceae bacterium]|nr:ral secretion pathway protein GspJ [Bacteriovoracaceae bacterium]
MKNLRSQFQKGFTLLEILVSIAIFAIIAAGIAGTMNQMTKLTKKLKVREATILSGQIALDRLQRDLQMAYNEKTQHSPSLFKATNIGTGPEITFSFFDTDIKILFKKRTSGVMLAHYSLEKDDNGTLKLLRAEGPLYLADKIKDEHSSILASGILDLKVEYYDARNDLWQDNWDTAAPATVGAFPTAVRVTITTVNPEIPRDEWKAKNLKLSTEFLILNESEVLPL